MKIEVPERNDATFERKLDCGSQLPIQSATRPHFSVSDRGVIQLRHAAQGAEVFLNPVTRGPKIATDIEKQIAVRLVLEPRRGDDRVQRPLRRKFPADAAARQTGWSRNASIPIPKMNCKFEL